MAPVSRARDFAAQSDPNRNPQFARRWTEPPRRGGFQSIGEVAAEVVADLAFRRKVQRLHGLGPRVVGELLAEIAAERGIRVLIERKVDKYTELEPAVLEAAGGDRLWPVPVREVRQP